MLCTCCNKIIGKLDGTGDSIISHKNYKVVIVSYASRCNASCGAYRLLLLSEQIRLPMSGIDLVIPGSIADRLLSF